MAVRKILMILWGSDRFDGALRRPHNGLALCSCIASRYATGSAGVARDDSSNKTTQILNRLSPGAGTNSHRRRLRSARRVSLRAAKIPRIQRGSRLGDGIDTAAASGPFGNQGGTGHKLARASNRSPSACWSVIIRRSGLSTAWSISTWSFARRIRRIAAGYRSP